MTEVLTALGVDPGWAKSGVAAVHRMPDGTLRAGGVRLLRTAPNKDKRFQRLRVSMDDERRLKEYYTGFVDAIETVKPKVIGIECYTIFESREYEKLRSSAAKFLSFLGLTGAGKAPFSTPAEFLEMFRNEGLFTNFLGHLLDVKRAVDAFRVVRGRGAAAKTQMVYSAALCAAYQYGIPVFVFMPVDLKKWTCGRSSATKGDVEKALCARVTGLREDVDSRIKAKTMHEHVFDATGHGVLALVEYEKWLRDSRLTSGG
jgi:Holliday junction resolvasome RuvABC endonuclease subunit